MELAIETLRNCFTFPFMALAPSFAEQSAADHALYLPAPMIVGALQDYLTVRIPSQSSLQKSSKDFGVGLPPLSM